MRPVSTLAKMFCFQATLMSPRPICELRPAGVPTASGTPISIWPRGPKRFSYVTLESIAVAPDPLMRVVHMASSSGNAFSE